MNLALTRRARTMLFFLSASAFTAWISGLDERSDAAGFDGGNPVSTAMPNFALPPVIGTVIARDPFAGAPLADASSHAKSIVATATDGPDPERIAGSASGLVVPNIGDAASVGAPAALVLRATIAGHNPVAYVENGTAMDIVRVGDTLGDQRVASIDLGGLTFADGTRLDLPGESLLAPPSAPAPMSVAQKIDDIRRLLTRLERAPVRIVVTPAPAAPTPVPTSTFPSPAPLATVDARGIPVGVNPTSDPNAPTPYPDPYPYAPPLPR